MATYPNSCQTYSSKQIDDGGFKSGRTVSGKLKIRSFYTVDVRQLTIVDELTDVEKIIHYDFYIANKKLEFDITWGADNIVYTCRFLGTPSYQILKNNRWSVTTKMEVV